MRVKPVLFLLIIVIALGIIFISLNKNKSSLSKIDSHFAFENTSIPDKITIAHKGSEISFENKNNSWNIDRGSQANSKLIAASIEILRNIQMDYPVAKSNQQLSIDSIHLKGTTIRLYNQNKLAYDLCFFDYNKKSFALNRHGHPFALSIKGHEKLCLGDVFKTDRSFWIQNLLIDLRKEEIRKIILRYEVDINKGFELNADTSDFMLLDSKGVTLKNSIPENINDYLHFFNGITFESGYRINSARIDSATYFQLEILTKKGERITLEAHPVFMENGAGKDINIFVGIVNKSDTLVLKYSTFDPILVDNLWFLKK